MQASFGLPGMSEIRIKERSPVSLHLHTQSIKAYKPIYTRIGKQKAIKLHSTKSFLALLQSTGTADQVKFYCFQVKASPMPSDLKFVQRTPDWRKLLLVRMTWSKSAKNLEPGRPGKFCLRWSLLFVDLLQDIVLASRILRQFLGLLEYLWTPDLETALTSWCGGEGTDSCSRFECRLQYQIS